MKAEDLLENKLDELGNAIPAEPTLVDSVMSRVREIPAPSMGRFRWMKRIGVLKPAVGVALCSALLVTIYSARVDDSSQQDLPPQTGARSAAVGEQPAVFFNPMDGAYINSQWGFIDKAGKVVVEAKYSRVDDFSEGLAAVKVGGTHFIGGKYGYIDRRGREIIKPQFDRATAFHEGLAAVKVNEKWGFIDRTGEFRIQPRFDSVSFGFREGLAIFAEGDRRGYMDRWGEVVIELRDMAPGSLFGEGLAAVAVSCPIGESESTAEVYGYIDRTGQIVIPPQFRNALAFSEGMAAVSAENGKWGFIDRDGDLVVPPKYDNVRAFEDGLAEVMLKTDQGWEKWAVINKDGTMVVAPRYKYDYGVLYSREDGSLECLYWDPATNKKAEREFDISRVYNLSEGMIRIRDGVTAGSKYGFADTAGNVVIAPQFEEVGDFSEGLAKFATGLNWDVLRKRSERGFYVW